MSRPPSMSTSPYHEALGFGSDHNQGPPRKKMRKGTKSCLECRRRKIKCTFTPGRPAICNECYARNSTCIDQEHGDIQTYTQSTVEQSSYSLRERVSQLEDLVRQVLNRLPEQDASKPSSDNDADTDKRHVDAQAAEVLKSLKGSFRQAATATDESILVPGGLREDAPALTLFDNAVITRKESQAVVSRAQYNKTKALLAALHKLLPPAQDLDIILEASHEWWAIWRTMFPQIADSRCETIKESVSHSLRTEKPAEVGKIMLCIAISVHQLPSTFDWSRLQIKEERTDLMERYIATVDKLITSDDEIAATVDGIECMLLEAKYHINMGRPRRAWLLYHRAIAFAQLLGLHRLPASPNNKSLDYQRSVNLWCHLVLGDRYISLLLGLPYTVAEAFVTPYIPRSTGPVSATKVNSGEVYAAKMLPIITKISDRNQSVTPMGYSATLRLDQELEELHNAQDPSWWNPDVIPGTPVEEHFGRLQAHFFHHQARVLLHMPFMLRSSADKRYQYSHSAALDGAREMIRIYDALRTNKSVGPFICKLVDFQAFTAAMLLLLNLCGYAQQHRGNNVQPPDLEQDQRDSDLIDLTIALLKNAAKEPGGVVAAQSAQALEMIARVRQGCEEQKANSCRNETIQVSIPYFGTISIGIGKQFVPIKPGTYGQRFTGQSISTTTRNLDTVPAGNAYGGMPNAGLPTPPSISSGSTQQSPLSTTIDNLHSQQSHHSLSQAQAQARDQSQSQGGASGYGSTNYTASGGYDQNQNWPPSESDDLFVNFDSFMAFPSGVLDLPSAGGCTTTTSSSSGFTPQQMCQSPYPSGGACGTTTTQDLNDGGGGGGGGADGVAAAGVGTGQPAPGQLGDKAAASVPQQGFPFGSYPYAQTAVELDQGWNWFGLNAPSM
ncbi:hypothetical protein HRR83_008226 [Exophiala dermatitidis]|uniref:Zn(2)-C6 fungal-type domain-containing protein n=2 Tax=Exophiala dermatitidis TaxID=5970 RepID=H6BSJ3_EXODN|nr:uncharacterized protein HMPREF1120_02374 [Exophiala dermatitidis NIH/UT8656]KAJ4505798.1 hypothetical protein HRR75_007178 [Exophiala dermatitidis]EHY54201.1 hypothetical protein HMPREF1120_02374 [Exophiala dermatitidis NIH/UT8656]KAJ4513654.1 hypothetical protein HRR73_005813 [Exophiala dermatitidis]KAJ4541203.1 hypothetical protein HRR78_007549 [Exophiala dermatitidis]KAJ4544425.1 hypothetical protein HRR76_002483 [Exophiala dermatitidis]